VISGLGFQINQLFENLITNSLKYRRTQVPLHIDIHASLVKAPNGQSIGASPNGWYHKIVVEDNGSGFPPVYAEKIFGLFQRVHTNENENGTGIGLTIVKKIVQNHNGFIIASGEVNEGARFEMYFPA
jgi:signal transduction histidine kinase